MCFFPSDTASLPGDFWSLRHLGGRSLGTEKLHQRDVWWTFGGAKDEKTYVKMEKIIQNHRQSSKNL